MRPEEPKALWPRLALAAGLAVTEAVESCGLQAGIKWPNDVWIGQRKVAGILVEAGSDFAVIGIGLNVNSTEFPPEVSEIAVAVAKNLHSIPEAVRPFAKFNCGWPMPVQLVGGHYFVVGGEFGVVNL